MSEVYENMLELLNRLSGRNILGMDVVDFDEAKVCEEWTAYTGVKETYYKTLEWDGKGIRKVIMRHPQIVTFRRHVHNYSDELLQFLTHDEDGKELNYMVVIDGDSPDWPILVKPGSEVYIPKGIVHGGYPVITKRNDDIWVAMTFNPPLRVKD